MTEDRTQWSPYEFAKEHREKMMKDVAARLKAWREARGYSVYKVALLCGTQHASIKRVEEAHRGASADILLAYCDLAHIHIFD